MRLFYLENESGDRKPLNNEAGVFLYLPEGLGVYYDDTYMDVGEGFFTRLKKAVSQRALSCKLCFIGNSPYQLYQEFIDWCIQSEKLYLIYKPRSIEYYRQVSIESFSKSEINEHHYLESATSLKFLTPWYLPTALSTQIEEVTDTAAIYNVSRYDVATYSGGVIGDQFSAEFTGNGHIPSSIFVRLSGQISAISNLKLSLINKATGTTLGECSLSTGFNPGETLEYSSEYSDSYVRKRSSNNEVSDIIDFVDVTKEPFFRVPVTGNYLLKIEGDNLQGSGAVITAFVYRYFKGV